MNTKKQQAKVITGSILTERVAEISNESKSTTKNIVNNLFSEINKALIDGEEIKVIGSFALKTTIRGARKAMNLKTKKQIEIPAKRVPKISFSAELKKKIAESK